GSSSSRTAPNPRSFKRKAPRPAPSELELPGCAGLLETLRSSRSPRFRRLGGSFGSTALCRSRKVLLPRWGNTRARDLDEHRRPRRLRFVLRMHVNLARQAVALAAVAGCAGGDDVLPDGFATAAAGDDVVDG